LQLGLDADIFFAQGTLRPDLIESASELASGCAEVIKTHHNDTALVRKLRDLVSYTEKWIIELEVLISGQSHRAAARLP